MYFFSRIIDALTKDRAKPMYLFSRTIDALAKAKLHSSLPVGLRQDFRRAVRLAETPPAKRLAEQIKPQSMLHEETLVRLYQCAKRTRHAILEIGAFTGGATVMLARAMIRSHNKSPLVTIEPGGAHDHPLVGTDDILRDLRQTLERYDIANHVTIVEGMSGHPPVTALALAALNGHKIGLVFIDADGQVERDFDLYREYLVPGAFVVIDDYVAFEGPFTAAEKTVSVVPWIAEMKKRGILREDAVVPWGTWFGHYVAN
jgi:predicted O-methyltransferase YrrM